MSRNKYPEQTQENILTTATKLFTEKGYDKTSIQDIINSLGISKGGIYHHFKSKEEILDGVIKRRSHYVMDMLTELIENTVAPSAKEKIQKILHCIATDEKTHEINNILSSQIYNPQFVVSGIQNCINIDSLIIAKLIDEGNKDGSLNVDDPLLCAETFMMLQNIWINPVLFKRDSLETENRLKYLQKTMKLLGADIINDELINMLLKDYDEMDAFNTNN